MRNFPSASVESERLPQWRCLSCLHCASMSSLFTRVLSYLSSKFACLSSSEEFDRLSSEDGLEQLPNELFLEIFSHLSLSDLHRSFYGLNLRLNQVIVYSCVRGLVVRSTAETNFYLQHILSDVAPWQVQTLKLSHMSSVDQLLDRMPTNLYLLNHLVLKRLKNISFGQCRQLLLHLPSLQTLTMIDFNTPQLDWLDDAHWNALIEKDLPQLRRLDVRICIIYHKQIYDDDKENIIYSYTSRFARPNDRLYTGSLKKRDPILEICLTIDRAFAREEI